MKEVLITTTGFLGDILFASSVAQHLVNEDIVSGEGGNHGENPIAVDYVIGYPQVQALLLNNPYIRNVFVGTTNGGRYDVRYTQPHHSFKIPPAIETQLACGVKNPSADFTVYTDPILDERAEKEFAYIKKDFKVIAWLSSWKEKSFLFTPAQYEAAVDVHLKGYGGANRDIPRIIDALGEDFAMLDVGFPLQYTQDILAHEAPLSFTYEASRLKQCDYFIGAEGGLANLAYGVGCKTILTSDFVWQLYGPKGVVKQVNPPQLGPRFYGKPGHVDLDPFLTDEQVIEEIRRIVNG